MQIIGRKRELEVLRQCNKSGKPEFLALHGRYGVGKTYLVSQFFDGSFAFRVAGKPRGGMKEQLDEFYTSLIIRYGFNVPQSINNWREAFDALENCLKQDSSHGRKVIFIDELPWLDTPKSGFASSLERFWNSYASQCKDILLIVSSSTSNLLTGEAPGKYSSLGNLATATIDMEPLNLHECELLCKSLGMKMTRQQIAEGYMIFGGIPYYIYTAHKHMSTAAGMVCGDNPGAAFLRYALSGQLKDETGGMYDLLFRVPDNHMTVAELLTKQMFGMTRQELSAASGISDGGGLTSVLSDMETCRLIGSTYSYRKKKGGDIYRLTDPFTLFYFCFVRDSCLDDLNIADSDAVTAGTAGDEPRFFTDHRFFTAPSHVPWRSHAFEQLCMEHVTQIKQKLGISGVVTETYLFRSRQKVGAGGTQAGCDNIAYGDNIGYGDEIGVIIDRDDNIINLCECKYSDGLYPFTEPDTLSFIRKRNTFRRETGTKKALRMTLISSNGLASNERSGDIQWQLTLDDLFAPAD